MVLGCITSSTLTIGLADSSIGESRAAVGAYFGVRTSPDVPASRYWSSNGKVWLRGRCELLLMAGASIGRPMPGAANGAAATPDSGVKKGDVAGLIGPGEKEEGAVSVNALFSDVVLCEWNGCRLKNSKLLSGLSFLRLSWLFALCRSTGEVVSVAIGDTGELIVASISASSGASELLRERAPMRLFLSLNFSSHVELVATLLSGVVVVAAKALALLRMRSSVSGRPFFSYGVSVCCA